MVIFIYKLNYTLNRPICHPFFSFYSKWGLSETFLPLASLHDIGWDITVLSYRRRFTFMSKKENPTNLFRLVAILIFASCILACFDLTAEGFSLPAKNWGICFGNSANFTGLRFNLVDRNIEKINGINITFWKPKDDEATGTVNGLSLGIVPFAESLNGIQLGVLGSGAKNNINGISIGILGAGCGGDMNGINIGGLGVGAGGSLTGFNFGFLGTGAGGDVKGINIGGLGIGAGGSLIGINIGGLGAGAGERVMGLNIGGLGVGCGDQLIGLTIAGIGAGAPTVKGITIAGVGAGGKSITGLTMALATIRITDDGTLNGLAVSAYNNIRGYQRGVSIGIVNYAYRVKGLQIGLINIIRDNPPGRKVLPIVNW